MAGIKTILRNIYSSGGGGSSFTFNTNDFDVVADAVSIDYANGQAASGSAKGFLTSSDWTTFNSKMTNPMTTAGDIIVGGPSGSPTRLAAGTLGYVLTGNGPGVAPSYQAPSGASLVPLGTIFTETWATLSSWTNVGSSTFSVAGNILTVNGGTPGSITLTNYRTNTGYGISNLDKTTLNATLTIGTIGATSHGVGFGWASSLSQSPYSLTVALITNSGSDRGKIGFYINNSLTAAITSTASMTINSSDVITVKIRQVKDKIIATYTNTTTVPGTSISATFDFNFSSTLVAGTGAGTPNSYYFTIYALGGTHTVSTGYTIASDEYINSDLVQIGNSITKGYTTGQMSWRANDVLNKNYEGYYSVNAGPSSRLSQINTAEVLAHTPRKILITGGEADKVLGDSDGTVQTAIANLVSAFQAGGYVLGSTLFITTLRPNNTVSVTGVNTHIRSTYPTSYIELYTPMWSGTGTTSNSAYFVDDGLHYNKAGAELEAAILANYFGLKPLKNVGLTDNPVVYNPNGNVTIGLAGKYTAAPVTFNVINTGGSQAHFQASSATATNSGGYLTATSGGNEFFMSAGAMYRSSLAWEARTAGAGLFGFSAGDWYISVDSGLTIGNTFTPTFRGRWNATGLFVGGSTSPTARLHLAAGTVTANTAPLKFTAGTNTTTAVAGQMEYDGTNLFFTRTGTTRGTLIQSDAVNSVSPTTPDRTITVNIAGTTLYIHAKTTND